MVFYWNTLAWKNTLKNIYIHFACISFTLWHKMAIISDLYILYIHLKLQVLKILLGLHLFLAWFAERVDKWLSSFRIFCFVQERKSPTKQIVSSCGYALYSNHSFMQTLNWNRDNLFDTKTLCCYCLEYYDIWFAYQIACQILFPLRNYTKIIRTINDSCSE